MLGYINRAAPFRKRLLAVQLQHLAVWCDINRAAPFRKRLPCLLVEFIVA